MTVRSQVAVGVALAALALTQPACERGCLAKRLGDGPSAPAIGGEEPYGSARRGGGPSAFDLGGTDCSDGLARCIDGDVETSIRGHVPYPCTASREAPGACACRWQREGACAAGCVKNGLEVVATAEVARAQLCAPTDAIARPLLAIEMTNVSICAGEAVTCVDGVVRACAARGQPVTLVAACVNGCAGNIQLATDEALTGDGPAAILCRRQHAERR